LFKLFLHYCKQWRAAVLCVLAIICPVQGESHTRLRGIVLFLPAALITAHVSFMGETICLQVS
jgi:hypothetical protein